MGGPRPPSVLKWLRHYPQPLYSEKYIKNGSQGTIRIFKNYFVKIFSVFSKISDIQMDLTHFFELLVMESEKPKQSQTSTNGVGPTKSK